MLLLGLFFFAVFFIRFSVEFRLIVENRDLAMRIKLGIGRFLFSIPHGFSAKIAQAIRQRNFGTFEAVLRSSQLALRFLRSALQWIVCFELEVLIGAGDPFWTALGVGGVWAVIGSLLGQLNICPEVRVLPNYENTEVQARLYCIFQFRLGQVIINELKRVIA